MLQPGEQDLLERCLDKEVRVHGICLLDFPVWDRLTNGVIRTLGRRPHPVLAGRCTAARSFHAQRRALWVGCLFWLGGCGPGSERFVEHPIADSVAADARTARTIGRGDGMSPQLAELRGVLVGAAGAENKISIGALDGGTEYIFGFISDVAIGVGGEILVADRQGSEIRVFDSVGSFAYGIGGVGEGPGEIRLPEALLLVRDDELWVADQDQTLHRFRLSDGQFVFTSRVRLEAYPYDACVLRGGMIVHAVRPIGREVLHRFGRDGLPQGGFAEPYRYEAWLPRESMSRGQIACDDRSGLVLLAFRLRNGIEAYDADTGELRWHAVPEGVSMSKVLEADGGSRVGSGLLDRDETHYLKRVAGGRGAPVLVQYERLAQSSADEAPVVEALETFAIDIASGEGYYLGDELPQVAFFDSETVVFLYEEPFPRIEVVRRQERRAP